MVCSITELNTLSARNRAFLEYDEAQTKPRLRDAQRDRAYAICDHMKEVHPRTKERYTSGYGVSPTGTGKTVLGCSMIVGMNRLPQTGKFVLGDDVQGRRAVIHVPTNLLLDRWEEELLGMPDGKGGRLKTLFPEIQPEHVGIYRASDSFEKKQDALKKPIVLITYDSARIISNHYPPILECNEYHLNKVQDILEAYRAPRNKIDQIIQILGTGYVEGDEMYKFFDVMQRIDLPKAALDQISEVLAIDFLSENQRQELQGAFLELLSNEHSRNPDKTTLAFLDEIDEKPRGDATSRYIDTFIKPNCYTFGATATHLYRNGFTTGDYLFGGDNPVFESTFQESVNGKEIAEMRNLVFEVDIPEENRSGLASVIEAAKARAIKKGANEYEIDYSEKELEKMARLSGIDNIAINVLLNGSDPKTGKRYLDMKSVWYCANVGHAQEVAEKINAAIEKYVAQHPKEKGNITLPYAEAVHGRMHDEEIDAVVVRFRNKETMALVNKKIMARGFNDREAELCFQLCPSRSPSKVLQEGGRVMRLNPNDKNKIANIISFIFPPEVVKHPEEQLVFGQLAGGMRMINSDFEFPSTEGRDHSDSNPRWWLNIPNASAITNDEEYKIFTQRFRSDEAKPENMLTCREMAQLLNPKAKGERLEREVVRLKQRLFDPLANAYNVRQARDKFVGLKKNKVSEEDTLNMRGQPFPVWRIGNFTAQGETEFCIDKDLHHLCRYAMFGAISERPPEFMTESAARQLVTGSSASNPKFNAIMANIMEHYLDRQPYTQVIFPEKHQPIATRSIGFFRQPGHDQAIDFCIAPEALRAVYRIYSQSTIEEAQQWWNKRFANYKTHEWLNKNDVRRELSISPTSSDNAKLDQLWARITTSANRGMKANPWAEGTLRLRPEGQGLEVEVHYANKRTPYNEQPELAIHQDSLTAIECLLGRAHVIGNDASTPLRGRRRNQ